MNDVWLYSPEVGKGKSGLCKSTEVGYAGGSGRCGCWGDEVRCLLAERCCPKREEACHGVMHERPTRGPSSRLLADHPLHGPAM